MKVLLPTTLLIQSLLLLVVFSPASAVGWWENLFGKLSGNDKKIEEETGIKNRDNVIDDDLDDRDLLNAAAAAITAATNRTIRSITRDERRFVLYDSRRLAGECLPICDEPVPTMKPSTSPTKKTFQPTKSPTTTPVKAPTSPPTFPERTDAPTFIEEAITEPPRDGGGEYKCIWPEYLQDFTAITEGDFISAAHTLPSKVAVGETFGNPKNHNISPGGKIFYKTKGNGNFNFNGGSKEIDTLFDVDPPVDFAYLQWLARNIKSSENGRYKVKVYTSGKEGTGPGGCYTLTDLRPEESAQSDGTITLAVFNTSDDICLGTPQNGRAFGPSVLAPFSKVTLESNYVDGLVIAKEFFSDKTESQLHGKVFKGKIECDDKPPATSCDEKLENLGYGFSEAIHDPALGSSHYGQDGQCFPKVGSMQSKPKGRDDAVSFFVGGNYIGRNGAEIEGNMVVLGNLKMEQNGPSNFVTVGEGSQIIPHNNGVAVKVGGDMSSVKTFEICRQNSRPYYPCKVVVKGARNDYNKIAPGYMTSDGFEYIQDSNLDLSEYEEQVVNLRRKSKYWGELADTPYASWQKSTVNSKKHFMIKCSNDDVVQVFNIPSSSLSGSGYDDYVFNENCSDKTVLINVHGGGSIEMVTKHMKWTKNGNIQNGGWANFPSCMNEAILWNFPGADNVLIKGTDEVQGSILIPGNLHWKSGSGQSGRTMVLGNLIHEKGGSEFHSFQFKPPKPLPIDCHDLIHRPAPAPGTPVNEPTPVNQPTSAPKPAPTLAPKPAPTSAPEPAGGGDSGSTGPPADCDTSKGCCSQDFKGCAGWGGNTKDKCNPPPWGQGSNNSMIWLTCGPLKGEEAQCSTHYTDNCQKNNVKDCCPGLACMDNSGKIVEKGSSKYAQCKPDRNILVGQYPR